MAWYNPVSWVKAGAGAAVESYHISREMMSSHYQRPEFKHSIAENIAHGDYGKKGEAITHADIQKWGDAKQQNYKTAETAMVTAAVVTASVVAAPVAAAVAGAVGVTAGVTATAGAAAATAATVGTAAGLAVDQGFKIADNAGAISARADGTRSNGALAKAVTGNASTITGKDVADDAIGLATALLPAAGKALAPTLSKVGGKVLQAVEDPAVKAFGQTSVTVAKETTKKAVDTVTHHSGKVRDVAENHLSKVVGEKTAGKVLDKAGEHVVGKVTDLAKDAAHGIIQNTVGKVLETAVGTGAATVGKGSVATTEAVATGELIALADKPAVMDKAITEAPSNLMNALQQVKALAEQGLLTASAVLKESSPTGQLLASQLEGTAKQTSPMSQEVLAEKKSTHIS